MRHIIVRNVPLCSPVRDTMLLSSRRLVQWGLGRGRCQVVILGVLTQEILILEIYQSYQIVRMKSRHSSRAWKHSMDN